MARPRGQVIVHYDVAEVAEASGRAFDKAARQVAGEIEAYMQAKCSRPYPPASKPGQYPKIRSGEHVSGIHVTGTRNGVTVYAEALHSLFLEHGTVNMEPRPWADRALNARDWMARIAKLARQFTGGSSKPKTRSKAR